MGPNWSFDATGLLNMCNSWDHNSAPIIQRERCRYVRNLMKKGYRSSRNEQITTDWRNRRADYWKSARTKPKQTHTGTPYEPEFEGILSPNRDLYELLTRAAVDSATRRSSLASLKSTFSAVFQDSVDDNDDVQLLQSVDSSTVPSQNPIFHFTGTDAREHGENSLSRIATSIQMLQSNASDSNGQRPPKEGGVGGVHDPFEDECFIEPCELSNEQLTVVKSVLNGIDKGQTGQTLTLVHGGGGTGKSYVVQRICSEVHRRRYEVVSTCPTGAGACRLINGRTFHSALKCSKKGNRLSAQSAAFLRQLFGPNVALVIVDEISMFKAKYLVLLDERLRGLYDTNKLFGGKSILLVRCAMLTRIN